MFLFLESMCSFLISTCPDFYYEMLCLFRYNMFHSFKASCQHHNSSEGLAAERFFITLYPQWQKAGFITFFKLKSPFIPGICFDHNFNMLLTWNWFYSLISQGIFDPLPPCFHSPGPDAGGVTNACQGYPKDMAFKDIASSCQQWK